MIHRREFEGKLAKELLKIAHFNSQLRVSLVSKDVKVVCICKVKSIGFRSHY